MLHPPSWVVPALAGAPMLLTWSRGGFEHTGTHAPGGALTRHRRGSGWRSYPGQWCRYHLPPCFSKQCSGHSVQGELFLINGDDVHGGGVTALCNYNYKESIYFTAPGSSFFINIILRNRSLAPCYSDDATQIFIEKRTK